MKENEMLLKNRRSDSNLFSKMFEFSRKKYTGANVLVLGAKIQIT